MIFKDVINDTEIHRKTQKDLYENPFLAASVLREYITTRFKNILNTTSDYTNISIKTKTKPIIDTNKNFEYIIKSKEADLFNDDDLIISTFYNLSMEHKNLLVFLFDHIIKISK
jgi:hypothetical protein